MNSVEMVNKLLKAKVEFDVKYFFFEKDGYFNYDNILIEAAKNGCLELIGWLVSSVDDFDFTRNKGKAFKAAAKNGHLIVCQYLHNRSLRRSLNFELKKQIFLFSAKNGDLDVIKWLFNRGFYTDYLSRQEALKLAIKSGNYDICEWLLDKTVRV